MEIPPALMLAVSLLVSFFMVGWFKRMNDETRGRLVEHQSAAVDAGSFVVRELFHGVCFYVILLNKSIVMFIVLHFKHILTVDIRLYLQKE